MTPDVVVATVVRAAFALLRALPVDAASALGGAVARTFGPLLRVHRVAERNLRRALPQLDDTAVKRTLRGMWDNLGRTAAEFSDVARIPVERIEVVGREHIEALRDDGKPGILISGHIGNWELMQVTWARIGLRALGIYRAANNAATDRIFQDLRERSGNTFAPKGKRAARAILAELRRGGHVALLVDQKQNDGMAAPFFGRDAMTGYVVAEMALRFGCPVLPMRVERLGGARFRIVADPPFVATPTGDHAADVLRVTRQINEILEAWITARPDQWFWVHRRWPD